MQLYYFYKIACLDVNITDCYIGSTCGFKKRYINHKTCCNNEKNNRYNLKIYQFIRSKGGWENWIMYPIDTLESDDKIAIRKRETNLMELHNSTLNSYNAYTDKHEYDKNYSKDYYINNKDYIRELKNQKFNCECGGKYTNANNHQHLRTVKHQTFLCQQII
jgi:hypothetical protein